MSNKGVSPIIGVILLLMIAVAISGATYTWISSMQSSLQLAGEKKVSETSEKTSTRFNIAYKECTERDGYDIIKTRIRNTGTAKIEKGDDFLAKISQQNSPIGSKVIELGESVSSGEISNIFVFNFTDDPIKEAGQLYDITFTLSSVSKQTTANCTS